MLKRETIGTAQVPGGEELALVSHGRDFIIMLGRGELMSTRMRFSEEQLAELTLARLGKADPHLLIGGYGAWRIFWQHVRPQEAANSGGRR